MKRQDDIYIGLGSNLGDRLANLQHAIEEIAVFAQIGSQSSVYETEPWGYADQSCFLNQVIAIATALKPEVLLLKMKKIEKALGRKRTFRYGPRVIDLDILLYKNEIICTPLLTIPHAAMHERAFVIVPLAEIAPKLVHPLMGKTMQELQDGMDVSGIRKYED